MAAEVRRRRLRLRATLLLRGVVFGACLLLLVGVLALGLGTPYVLVSLAVAAVLWFGIESGLLLLGLEYFVLSRRDPQAPSLWFVDVDAEREHELTEYHADTEDNPTLR